MYKKTISPSNDVIIFYEINGTRISFQENQNHPEVEAYLAWVAEGNVAEEWNPNGN